MNQLLNAVTTNQLIGTAAFAVIGACLGVWLAAAWWAYADMGRRSDSELVRLLAPAWMLASTPIMLPLSLATYLLLRPQETVAERRSRRILGALVPSMAEDSTCSGCGRRVEEGWRRCPACSGWLSAPCSRCGHWSSVDLDLCPFCASDWAVGDSAAEVPGLVSALPVVRGEARTKDAPAPGRSKNRTARDGRRAGRAASVPGLARIGR